jgi:hypothetical protein
MVTPREKAKELVEKYIKGDFNEFEYVWISDNGAKQCALIAVDEILSFIEDDRTGFNWKDYWQEVKREIEKL